MQSRALHFTNASAFGAVVLGFIVTVAWFFRPLPPVPVNVGSAGVPTRVNHTFDNTITLVNYGLNQDHFTVGDTAIVTLSWQARVVPQSSYAVSIHLQDANDSLVAKSDGLPVNATRPTTSWKTDEVIEDSHEIHLPATLAQGSYKLIVGLYDPSTGDRLNANDEQDAIVLTTVTVQCPMSRVLFGLGTGETRCGKPRSRIQRG